MSPDPTERGSPGDADPSDPNTSADRPEAADPEDAAIEEAEGDVADDDEGEGADDARPCEWVSLPEALGRFATHARGTQSAEHIKPLHWYVACRLVLEGGFHPDDIMPRPPFTVTRIGKSNVISYDPAVGGVGERVVLGGLKTKNVDVVVTRNGIGPTLAVSCKGMTGALRNLTNRMEETIGEVTNIHITYPALVFGYLFLLRANRQEEAAVEQAAAREAGLDAQRRNDRAFGAGGDPVEGVLRFHYAMQEISGRRGVRDEISRYEAVSFMLVEPDENAMGRPLEAFPLIDSSVHFRRFFPTLYQRYEERFVFGAPLLKKRGFTNRLAWSPRSPALQPEFIRERFGTSLDYEFNLAPEASRPPRRVRRARPTAAQGGPGEGDQDRQPEAREEGSQPEGRGA